ncbi:hypothetical protein [Actinomycetospora termitidis]|uniref:Uncharacterized protein n=1 Tax=Actinomycetospora termitidis TaxID=3053470 RepID=A0ABT7MG75_9PSEU|nr:hypothetical protein [Actinomycetospora sp. Odt1-22]MDL5159685.1 hypothetical protein [Actinomycetospora sp. Odt1-22]
MDLSREAVEAAGLGVLVLVRPRPLHVTGIEHGPGPRPEVRSASGGRGLR